MRKKRIIFMLWLVAIACVLIWPKHISDHGVMRISHWASPQSCTDCHVEAYQGWEANLEKPGEPWFHAMLLVMPDTEIRLTLMKSGSDSDNYNIRWQSIRFFRGCRWMTYEEADLNWEFKPYFSEEEDLFAESKFLTDMPPSPTVEDTVNEWRYRQ